MTLRWEPTPRVDWCHLGKHRFTDPFFEETIARCFSDPFNLLFRHETPLERLVDLYEAKPGLTPSGFIFHVSRCGSTLISRLLATLPQNVVLSEAGPLDAVLRAGDYLPALSHDAQADYVRAMIGALGQQRRPEERHLIVKFDAWNIHDLPLLRRAFPDVPWIFVFRDPVEVLVSHQRVTGAHMIPGVLPPAVMGLTPNDLSRVLPDEYAARVLGKVCEAGVRYVTEFGGRAVDYKQLPDAVWSWLPDHFGITCTENDRKRMREAGKYHAKSPAEVFQADTVGKKQAATERIRALAQQWATPWYERLLTLTSPK